MNQNYNLTETFFILLEMFYDKKSNTLLIMCMQEIPLHYIKA